MKHLNWKCNFPTQKPKKVCNSQKNERVSIDKCTKYFPRLIYFRVLWWWGELFVDLRTSCNIFSSFNRRLEVNYAFHNFFWTWKIISFSGFFTFLRWNLAYFSHSHATTSRTRNFSNKRNYQWKMWWSWKKMKNSWSIIKNCFFHIVNSSINCVSLSLPFTEIVL